LAVGGGIVRILVTSKRFVERSILPHCVAFRAGEFGLSIDCVAQCESLFSIRREELGQHIGTLDAERWRAIVKALGNMMGSDCEPR
jgi:mRNA-degrading endonuclease toxin of MazEF toxin-antitoxin module